MKSEEMTVVISGATGGVGIEIAEIFAKNGYDTLLLGRNADKLRHLSKKLVNRYGTQSEYCLIDATDEKSIEKCITYINDNYEQLMILINVAGVFPIGPAIEVEDELYNECMDVNLKLPFLLSVGLFNLLKINGKGKVINIGSSSSYSGFKNTVIYCASKHALLGLSRSLNDEWKEQGVSVHCISPGTIDTSMANVLTQDSSTYISPSEFSQLVYDVASYKGNMLVEEVRATRRVIR